MPGETYDNKFDLTDTAFASYSKKAQSFLAGFKYAVYKGNPHNWQDVLVKWNLPADASDYLIEQKYREMLAELDRVALGMGPGEAGYFFEKLTGDYNMLQGKPGFKWVKPAKGWRESVYNKYMRGDIAPKQETTEEQITELSSQIDRFESHGNFMSIYFKSPKDVESLKKAFADLGIQDIVKAKAVSVTGTEIQEYMIEVNYNYSTQKKIIDDLIRSHNRIKAWSVLRGYGGVQMTEAEKKFFMNQDARMVSRKLQQSKGI